MKAAMDSRPSTVSLAMRHYLFIIPFYFKEMLEQGLMCIGPVQNQNNIYIFFYNCDIIIGITLFYRQN